MTSRSGTASGRKGHRSSLVVRKTGQRREKLQAVTAVVAAVPRVLRYQHAARMTAPGEWRERAGALWAAWLVEVRLAGVGTEPWWLVTDHPVDECRGGNRSLSGCPLGRIPAAVGD